MIKGLKEVEGFVHSLLRAFHGVEEQEQIIEYKGAKIKVTIEILEKHHIKDLKSNTRNLETEKLLDKIKDEEINPVLCMNSHPMHGWVCGLLLAHKGDCMAEVTEEITWERSR